MKKLNVFLKIVLVSIFMFFFTIDFSKKYLSLNPIGIKFTKGFVESKTKYDDKAGAVGYNYTVTFFNNKDSFRIKTSININSSQYILGDSVRVVYNKYYPNYSMVINFEELLMFLMLFGIPNIIVLGYYKRYCFKKKVDVFNKEQE